MYLFILIILILLGIVFLAGLLFFIRSLILKKNIGCGLLGLLTMVIIALVVYFNSEILSYRSKSDFIYDFERVMELDYPHSGKIIEKKYERGFNVLGDYAEVVVIEMDTLDYGKLLQDIRLNKNFELNAIELNKEMSPFFLLNKNIPVSEFEWVYRMKNKYNCCLWFHKNRKTIVFVNINY